MQPLPTNPAPYAGFIFRHLLQEVSAEGDAGLAIAETELPIQGDHWFWADDNAKVLEFLALPEVWRSEPEKVVEVLRFVQSMCDGPFIFRRLARPQLDLIHHDGGVANFRHSFMNIGCDLAKGVVNVSMRFHDDRTAKNVVLTGNYVQFTFSGKRFSLDVENAISNHDVLIFQGGVRLIHTSELMFECGSFPFPRRKHRLGRLTYTYGFSANSMFFTVNVALEIAPGTEVSDVILTIGQDNLSHNENGVTYGDLFVQQQDGEPLNFVAGKPGRTVLAIPAARYWCFAQNDQMRGFALAIHSVPMGAADVSALGVIVDQPNKLHWVVAEYAFPGTHNNTKLVCSESKIITAGGFYDRVADCAEMMRGRATRAVHDKQPIDLSISYDYGAEINAFARCHKALSGPNPPVAGPSLRETTKTLFDRYYAAYAENLLVRQNTDCGAIFSRSLAFIAFGLIDMVASASDPRYRVDLAQICDAILTFERQYEAVDGTPESGFLMGIKSSDRPYFDCHSANLLALVRAVPILEDARFLKSIDLGLAAYRLDTVAIIFYGPRKQDVVSVDFVDNEGKRMSLDGYWNFGPGLALRMFNALRKSSHPGIAEIYGRHRDRLDLFTMVMHRQIHRSLHSRDDILEIKTGILSAESNSETQPWVALGLIDEAGDDHVFQTT
jgi:hypothetical protein